MERLFFVRAFLLLLFLTLALCVRHPLTRSVDMRSPRSFVRSLFRRGYRVTADLR
jgi:hypothetical protein